MVKPICFMVMPFGVKEVPAGTAKAPGRVDFDRLWHAAIRPTLEVLGYVPVRADQEVGALIIHEMLERLYFADLVLAEMSIPNGNVYYEIGVRHAAKPKGCVLVAADWSLPLFDAQQMRRLVYPLPEEHVSDAQAESIAKVLKDGIPKMRIGGSPMFQVLGGYPGAVDENRALTMRDELAQHAAFTDRIRAIELIDDRDKAREASLALAARFPAADQLRRSVAVPIVKMLRDRAGWKSMADYVDALPDELRELPLLKEQRALATSKLGNNEEAIAAIEGVIAMHGESSERRGLVGGRYKRIAAEALKSENDIRYRDALDRAIEAYERGMKLELGDYFCASNLARLYRERGDPGDDRRAEFAHRLTVTMVEAAIESGKANEWARPTLLGAAFDAADVGEAARLVKAVRREGAARWILDSTLADLDKAVQQVADPTTRAMLDRLLGQLREVPRN